MGRIARRALSSGPQQAPQPAEEDEGSDGGGGGGGGGGGSREGRKRPNQNSKITAAHIVRQRQRKVCQLQCEATLEEAIKMLSSNNSSSCMVYDDRRKGKEGQKEVVGIFSSRDIIKKLSKQGQNALEALRSPIKEVSTVASGLVGLSCRGIGHSKKLIDRPDRH